MAVEMPTIGNKETSTGTPASVETATPAETPAETKPEEPVVVNPREFSTGQEVDQAVLDMMALQEEQEAEDGEPAEPPVVAPPPSEEPPPVTPAEAPAPAAPAEVQPPEVPKEAPPPEQPQPAVATPEKKPEVQGQQPAPTKEAAEEPKKVPLPGEFAELAQAVQEQRGKIEESLTALYTPTEKQMEEFHANPEKVLGGLAARLHLEVVQNTLGVLAQNIPSAVNGVIAARQQHDQREAEFYEQWPQLSKDDPAQKQVVMQIARAYAQANPQADSKTRIRQIGAQAMVALNLLPTQAPAAPAAPVAQAPAPAQQQAFAPAAQAASTAPPSAPKKLTGWEAIDASFEESEAL